MITLLDKPDTIYTLSHAQDNCEALNAGDNDGWTYVISPDGNMTGGYVINAFDEDGQYAATF